MFELMQRAGRAVFDLVCRHHPGAKHWLILAGHGNNGGDAFVLAHLAKAADIEITICLANPAKPLSGDALTAQQAYLRSGGKVSNWQTQDFSAYDLIIDGLLGTGISHEVRTPFDTIINAVNGSGVPVVSIDLPSGLDADTGAALGCAVAANATVTFVGSKAGLVTGQGKSHTGKLFFNDLGVGSVFNQVADPKGRLIRYARLKPLPTRPQHSHKGTFGRLLCVGGGPGMPGAIRLASEAGLRTGAGLVRVFSHTSSLAFIGAGRPELMLSDSTLTQWLNWADVVALGPGLGQSDWSVSVFAEVLAAAAASNMAIVIDADGLNLLAEYPQTTLPEQVVLTPHPGEAARLLGLTNQAIESDRYAAAKAIADKFQCICVLKGAGTLIASVSSNACLICEDGNPGMATAGMGDTLTGIIAALLSQGLAVESAAEYGVCIHSAAADSIAEKGGQRGIIASDIIDNLRTFVNF